MKSLYRVVMTFILHSLLLNFEAVAIDECNKSISNNSQSNKLHSKAHIGNGDFNDGNEYIKIEINIVNKFIRVYIADRSESLNYQRASQLFLNWGLWNMLFDQRGDSIHSVRFWRDL